jgi:hypothetical protein
MRQLLGTLSLVVLLQSFPVGVSAQAQTSSTVSSDAIGQVVAANLMNNYPDGNFYPERFISRAELASTLVKAFQLDKRQSATQGNAISVPDVPSSHWAYKDIQTVLKTGIMKGYRDNMFFPNQRVTRGEAFAIFAQAYGVFQFPDNTVAEILSSYPDATGIPNWARRAIATAVNEGFVNLDDQGNIKPSQPMTRGDMAHALSKYLQRQQKPASVENTRE